MGKTVDIEHKVFRDEVVIYASTPKGAGWVAKHITTNVADLHYADKRRGFEVLGSMAEDGLNVIRLDTN